MLARTYGPVRFEKLNIKNMTRSARGTTERPGRQVRPSRPTARTSSPEMA
ncbi:hypothetical protein OHB54_45315 [Streptomyces sp. NBC_01007]|nr:hypothetical protein OHB54_45315 [Streptomyces sp. NBC_01007]